MGWEEALGRAAHPARGCPGWRGIEGHLEGAWAGEEGAVPLLAVHWGLLPLHRGGGEQNRKHGGCLGPWTLGYSEFLEGVPDGQPEGHWRGQAKGSTLFLGASVWSWSVCRDLLCRALSATPQCVRQLGTGARKYVGRSRLGRGAGCLPSESCVSAFTFWMRRCWWSWALGGRGAPDRWTCRDQWSSRVPCAVAQAPASVPTVSDLAPAGLSPPPWSAGGARLPGEPTCHTPPRMRCSGCAGATGR